MTKKKSPADDLDLEAELATPASPEDLAAVETIVSDAIKLTQRIEKGEQLLKELKAELNVVSTKTLPDIMARANTSLHKVMRGALEGWKVEIVPLIAGSLPKVTKNDDTLQKREEKKASRERGLNFIREAGAADIIKTVMTIEFDKSQDNIMGEVKEFITEKWGLAPEIDSDVHHKTLASFAAERLKKGEELPIEDLGLFIGRTAKLTPPKGK